MFRQWLLSLCLVVAIASQFGASQEASSSFSPTITGTATLTVPLESFYTDFSQITETAIYSTTISGTPAVVTTALPLFDGLQNSSVAIRPGYVINDFADDSYAFCWFPISGNWGLLPRILFYGTIVFALVARNHEWLVAGALAASLTFSGVAAIQISLQVWTKQIMAELDLLAILGILSTSCIIAIPLMNWSSTIRYLGLSEQEKARQIAMYNWKRDSYNAQTLHQTPKRQDRAKDTPTRTVIVFWALLVAVGFLSAFVAFRDLRDPSNTYISLYTWAGVNTTHCVPDDGILDLRAGQYDGWYYFWFDEEFMTKNNCENPCQALPAGQSTLFRSASDDLKILNAKQVDNLLEQTEVSTKEMGAIKFTGFYFTYLLFGLPFIIVQGFMHLLLFRKYTPQQARHRTYMIIAGTSKQGFQPTRFRKGLAFAVALFLYLVALFILVITPFVLVLNVAATESFLYLVPQSEDNKHVGQWGVPVGTALVLITAVICRFEFGVRQYIRRARRDASKAIRHQMKHRKVDEGDEEKAASDEQKPGKLRRKSSYKPDKAFFSDLWHAIRDVTLDGFTSIARYFNTFGGIVGHEWNLFVQFCKHPEEPPPLRKRPEPKMSRRQRAKAHASDRQPNAIKQSNILTPQFEDFGAKSPHYSGTKNQDVETRVHPALVNETEHPLLTQAPTAGNNVATWAGRSKALSHNHGHARQMQSTSPPPLGKRENSHQRKPVPGATSAVPTFHTAAESFPMEQTQHHQQNQDEDFLAPDFKDRPQRDSSTVMASLSEGIADRPRRSNIYYPSPELSSEGDYLVPHSTDDQLSPRSHAITQPQHRTQTQPQMQSPMLISPRSDDGLIPVTSEEHPSRKQSRSNSHNHSRSSEQDLVPPLPPPKSKYNTQHLNTSPKLDQTPHMSPIDAQSQSLPQLSRRSSYLFSEEELARLYRSGTPQIRSVMASRNSIAAGPGSNTSTGIGAGAGLNAAAGRVSYLQIQTGADFADTEGWGDQVVLKRDRYGRWVVVDAGEGGE